MIADCPACGHSAGIADGPPLAESIVRCDECGARVAFGRLAPRVVVEPIVDEHGRSWVRRRYQDAVTGEDLFIVDLDPQYAASEAKNILSLVIP